VRVEGDTREEALSRLRQKLDGWREQLRQVSPVDETAERLLEEALTGAETLEAHREARSDILALLARSNDLTERFRVLLGSIDRLEEEWTADRRYTDDGISRLERSLADAFARRLHEGARQWFNELANALRAQEFDAVARVAQATLPFSELEPGAVVVRDAVLRALDEPEAMLKMLERVGDGTLEGWEATLDSPTRARGYRLAAYFALGPLGDTERARRYVDEAVEIDPYSGLSHAERAAFFLFVGDLDQAATDAQHAIDLAADDPSGWVNLGTWAELTGDFEYARELYESALNRMTLHASSNLARRASLLPPTGLLLAEAAEHLLRHGRPSASRDSAYAALETGIRGSEYTPEARVYRVLSVAMEELPEHSPPEIAVAAFEAGKRFVWNAQYELAIEQLDRALEFDDSNPEVGWWRADALVGWGSPDPEERRQRIAEARQVWDSRAARVGLPAGDTSWAYLTRALIAAEIAQPDAAESREGLWEALLFVQRALTHDGLDGRRWGFAARFLRDLELPALAFESVECGYHLNESDSEVLQQRMMLLANLGRFQESERVARALVDSTGQTPWLAGWQAWLALQQGRYDEALGLVELALSAEWDVAWYLDLRALCHIGRGEIEAARADYSEGLARVRDGSIPIDHPGTRVFAAIAATIAGATAPAREWLEAVPANFARRDDMSIPAVKAFIELGSGDLDRAREYLTDAVELAASLSDLADLGTGPSLRVRTLPNDELRKQREQLLRDIEQEFVPKRREKLKAKATAEMEVAQGLEQHRQDSDTAKVALLALDANRVLARGDTEGALQRFEQLVGSSFEPEASLGIEGTLFTAIDAAVSRGDIERIRESSTRLLASGRVDELEAALTVTWALERAGRLDEASKELAAFATQHRDDPRIEYVYQRLGEVALHAGDATDAVDHFGRALETAGAADRVGMLETRFAIASSVIGDVATAQKHILRGFDAWQASGLEFPGLTVAADARAFVDDVFPKDVRQAAERVAALAELRDSADA
jgi:tetratricopeptide (TPR) repeat protein